MVQRIINFLKTETEECNGPLLKKTLPILHIDKFRTEDGKGTFLYHQYQLREQIKKLVHDESFAPNEFYLTTGRTIVHYNNAAQTVQVKTSTANTIKILSWPQLKTKERIGSHHVVLKTQYE